MSLFKKFFTYNANPESKGDAGASKEVPMALDESFVQNFIKKSGKFLYCTSLEDVNQNLLNILKENSWDEVLCYNKSLEKNLVAVNSKCTSLLSNQFPFYTNCEHLLADDGSILFSSNQLCGNKLTELPENFIVLAKTSQLVKNKGEGLMGIKSRCKGCIPSNITAIKRYNPYTKDDNFMNYGNNNAKNLYLLLLEDL